MITIQLIFILLSLYSLIKFKDTLLKVIIVVLWYPLFLLYLFSQGVPMKGILGLYESYFSPSLVDYAINSYIVGFYSFLAVLWRVKDKKYNLINIEVHPMLRNLLFLITVFFSTFLLNTHGDGMKSATFYLSVSTILLATHQKRDLLWLLHCVLCFFLILKGERVDSLLIIILLFLTTRKANAIDEVNWKQIAIWAPAFFVLLVFVGFLRGGEEQVTTDMIITSFYTQGTVSDVVYIYLTGVKHFFEHGPYYDVLYNLIFGILPGEYGGTLSKYNFTAYLNEYMPNPGGGMYFTEGTICFGWFGPVLYMLVYGYILRKLLVNTTVNSRLILTLIIVMQCRIVWYGFIYMYKPLVILFVLYYVAKKTNSIRVIQAESEESREIISNIKLK